MDPTQALEHKPRLRQLLRFSLLLSIFVLTLAIVLFRERLGDLGALGYAGAFVAMLLSNATLVLPAPGLIIVFALGGSLNPVLVGVCGAAGGSLGELTGYVTGYSGIGLMVETPTALRIHHWMARRGTLTIFALSVIPSPFFDLAGMMAGAGRMSIARFLLITFAGKTIQAIAIATAGALSLDWVEGLLAH